MLELINSTTYDQLGFVAIEFCGAFQPKNAQASREYPLASLRYMPECFSNATSVDDFLDCQAKELTACFRSRRAAIHAYVSGRRMAMSTSAMHVAANITDHYITQYTVEPMEQLQNSMTRYTMGLPPLEIKEKHTTKVTKVTDQKPDTESN